MRRYTKKEELGSNEVMKLIEKARLIENNESAYEWARKHHKNVLNKKTINLKKWQSKKEAERPLLKADDSE